MNLTQQKKKGIRRRTCFFGVVFLLLGLIFAFDWEPFTKKVYDTYKCGPFVMIACDVPNQDLNVTMTAYTDGRSELFFTHTGEADSANFWVYVIDYYAPFNWKLLENAEGISLRSQNEHAYVSSPSGAASGEGRTAAFRLRFQKGDLTYSRIVLQPSNGRHLIYEKEKRWFRIPQILFWRSSDIEDLYDANENGTYTDPRWISKTVDGAVLYAPILLIRATIYNHAYVNPGWVVESVSPKSYVSGYYFLLSCEDMFFPVIQYKDLTWQTAFERNGVLAGLFFGIGISLLWIVIQYPTEKRRKQK